MSSNAEIKSQNTDMILYHGYQVYRNGRILSKRGREIKSYYFTYPNSHVSLTIDGKVVKKNKALLIYSLFSGTPVDTYLYVLQFRDGDTSNASFDNLYLKTKQDYYRECKKSGRGHNRFDEKTKKKIRKDYRERNLSFRALCEKYNCSILTVQRIVNQPPQKEGNT